MCSSPGVINVCSFFWRNSGLTQLSRGYRWMRNGHCDPRRKRKLEEFLQEKDKGWDKRGWVGGQKGVESAGTSGFAETASLHKLWLVIISSVVLSAWPTGTQEHMGGYSPPQEFSTLVLAQTDLDPGQHNTCKALKNTDRPLLRMFRILCRILQSVNDTTP